MVSTERRFRDAASGWFVAAVCIALAILPRVSWSQGVEAALRGRAAPNAQITVRNTATGLTRRTQAAADGSYSIVGLPPGPYQVNSDGGAEANVTLAVASTITLNLEAPAAAEEVVATVTVKSTRPTEVKTSEIGTIVAPVTIETLPQVTRNFLEFADTVPGMAFTVDYKGNTSLVGGAQNASGVNVFIDGVGQKNYVKEGGVSGNFASQGNPFPQLAIGEYKVITSNYKAEFDQITSAAVTADTKSGTNEFHGEAFGTFTGHNFRAETPAEADAGSKAATNDKEFGAAFGGPIIQDLLHFFVTYEGKRLITPVAVTPGNNDGAPFLPAEAAAQLGPASLPFKEDLYFGKLDWAPTDKDRFVLAGKVRRETQSTHVGFGLAASANVAVLNNDTRIDVRWQHTEDWFFNELLFTYEDAYYQPAATTFGNGLQYTYQPSQDQLILSVGPADPRANQFDGQRGPGIQDDFTLNGLHWLGVHTVKTGFKLKRIILTAQDAADINPQFFYDVNPTGSADIPYKAFFTKEVPGQSPIARSDNTQFGIYLQDDWAPTEKLTFNLGVRWDYEKTPAYLDRATPADVVAAINSQDPFGPPGQTYAQTLAKGGVNINDYISNGHNRSAPTNEIAPRFGVSYDINGDQKHVVFGGAGRSYDRDLFTYLQLEQTKSSLPQYNIFFNVPERPCTPSPTCIPFDPRYLNGLSNLQSLVVASNSGQEVDALNNSLKVPYSDQFSIGMRNRIGDWNTSITAARILSHDGFAFTPGNRLPDGSFWQNGNAPNNNPIPGFGSLILGNNGIETRSTQLLLSIEKPFTEESRWGVTFAYTFTDAKQNRDIHEHYSLDEETIAQYPFIASNAAAKHRFVTSGTLRGPWHTTLGAKWVIATPIPDNVGACYLPDGQVFPTGSKCTPVAVRPPDFLGYRDLDLQVSKDFAVHDAVSVYVRLDLLNVFNNTNYSDYNVNFGTTGVPPANPVTFNQVGNILGTPRTLKLQGGVRF
ncbi:MAG TPA: TonB-dependent receptor [Steroidobacteraceae bacterium]|nr:TonB-dependent receptor [Steroidobacteraceae bacterium]